MLRKFLHREEISSSLAPDVELAHTLLKLRKEPHGDDAVLIVLVLRLYSQQDSV